MLRVHKRWSADDRPVTLARDVVPVLGPDTEVDPTRPMVEVALALTGERVGWEVVRPGADALGADDAALADRTPGEPVLTLDVTGVGLTGRVVYWTSEVHLRGGVPLRDGAPRRLVAPGATQPTGLRSVSSARPRRLWPRP
ncbi:hypothetical protein G5V59_05680 [Nocardioides sp. W3-2-3]|uniref:hypothetical protein n=1 Tax=Nocardioides convexus TaxID=2712224 RepID=UPI002418B240|nr:hypothetical protein [Nocardioides convexus]NGZ99917.1 hypothetical protein [Nocardioides convexus]